LVLRRSPPVVLAAFALLALAGCGGGSVSHEQVQKQLEAIQSLAAEGALVADGVADDRTTHVFVRVHAGYLDHAARKVATKLSSASSTGPVERDRARAARLAGGVAARLAALSHQPADRADARRIALELRRDAARAEHLAR
jgi:hypothetical protein